MQRPSAKLFFYLLDYTQITMKTTHSETPSSSYVRLAGADVLPWQQLLSGDCNPRIRTTALSSGGK